ncbi:hypothetical protein [Arthrobacter roseus]|uniref:hypothetical protein n=1 Tax=Arthrobacter roseus TaxID=136274 RepID=UPI0019629440|nr:hypothetical protein [Arthrobacter roseus]MBM7848723.1 hypothetical protein [Arthrobacter roseus]
MPKSLTTSVRRQIVEFDPMAADGPSVSELCQHLGISRPDPWAVPANTGTSDGWGTGPADSSKPPF